MAAVIVAVAVIVLVVVTVAMIVAILMSVVVIFVVVTLVLVIVAVAVIVLVVVIFVVVIVAVTLVLVTLVLMTAVAMVCCTSRIVTGHRLGRRSRCNFLCSILCIRHSNTSSLHCCKHVSSRATKVHEVGVAFRRVMGSLHRLWLFRS